MLVLSRKQEEKVVISGGITIRVLSIRGGTVRLGIEAPKEIDVDRGEIKDRKTQSQEDIYDRLT